MTDLINNPVEWGRKLILTNDHDPLYVGLTEWDVKGSRLRRFMLAYWCCYSVGASYWISDHSGTRFWQYLHLAAENPDGCGPQSQGIPGGGARWPRAHERRHWRGQKCVDSVEWLRSRFNHPEEAVISLEGCRTLEQVNKAMDWPQFGPWIAFKAADMLERVLGVPITFPEELVTLYKDPREGAEMMSTIFDPTGNLGMTPQRVVEMLLDAYAGILAPGFKGKSSSRFCNIQEVETVLCKWKSARKGHYFIGKDTQDHRRELAAWGAQDLLAVYPTGKA